MANDVDLEFDDEKTAPIEDEVEEIDEIERKQSERRERKKAAKQRKKRRKIILIVLLVLVIALGASYYFFLGDIIKQYVVNYQITQLANMEKYANVDEYALAVTNARTKFAALPDEAKANVDEYALAAAETKSSQLTLLAANIAALPQNGLTVADYPAALATATDARAQVDALTAPEQALVGVDALSTAEALLTQFRADNTDVITLNEDIAALVVSEDTSRAALDAEIAAYNTLSTRVDQVTLASPDADTATLLSKKALIDAKISALYSTLSGEVNTITSALTTMNTEMDALDAAIAAGKKSGSKTTFDTVAMTASMDKLNAAMDSVSTLLTSSTGAAMLSADTTAITDKLTAAKTQYTEAFNYMTSTTVDSSKKLEDMKKLFDTAKASLQACSTDITAYNDSVNTMLNGYVAFTDGNLAAAGATGETTPGSTPAEGTTTPDTTTEGGAAATTTEGEAGYLLGDDINLRSGAGTEFDSLGKFNKNTTLTILETSGDWYKVKVGEKEGYIRKDLVAKGTPSN